MSLKLTRMMALMRRDYFIYRKPVLFISLALIVIVTLILYMQASEQENHSSTTFITWLFILGGILASSHFTDFRSHSHRVSYLSLPASNLEKHVTHILYCTLGFISVWLIVFGLGQFFANILIEYFTTSKSYESFLNFHMNAIDLTCFWLLVMSIFFMFSIVFNRFALVKSFLLIALVGVVFALIVFLMFYLIYFEHIPWFKGEEFANSREVELKEPDGALTEEYFQNISHRALFVLKFCAAPFFFIVSYFKLKEKEA